MLRAATLALAASTTLASAAAALEYPAPGTDDPNMRTAVYRPSQRYLVVGRLRHQTTLVFGKDEVVTGIALGDSEAWEGQKDDPRLPRHVLVLWPISTAPTNLEVTTRLPDGSERPYHFALTAHDAPPQKSAAASCPPEVLAVVPECATVADPTAIFGLTFVYPREERTAALAKAKEEAEERQARIDAERAVDRLKVDVFYGARNWRYLAVGDRRIAPTEVSDNRRLTGFRYPGTLAMPAMFYLGPDGLERSIMFDRTDDVAITRLRARVWTLRQGASVVNLFNCDGMTEPECRRLVNDPSSFAGIPFADPGPDPRTGTTSPNVIRQIKTRQ